MKKLKFINSNALKILAMAFMLLDHLWATIIPDNQWMTCVGRLAFPIFAFMISEGYVHTSDFKKYAKRLLIFGLISEIPFNLMSAGGFFFPFHQNVMFTLLLGLLVKVLKWQWIADYALPISLVVGMASAIPFTAWLA